MLFASGDKATPTSPMAPDRESGAIIKKGTAVVIVFSCNSCVGSSSIWPQTGVAEVNIAATVRPRKEMWKICFIVELPKLIK